MTLLISSTAIIQVVIVFFTPRIGKYTQDAAIEFYKSKSEEVCYIETLGYKSYATYFYGKKSKDLPHLTRDELLEEYIEEPVYFVCKITSKERYLEQYPQLEILEEKNGFVFFKKINY